MPGQGELQSFNFSIDTMEAGIGNAELLNDLASPESVTADSDDLQDLKDEKKEIKQPPAKVTPKKEVKKEEVVEDEIKEKSLSDMLSEDEEDDTEEEENVLINKAKEAKKKNQKSEESLETETPETNAFAAFSKDLLKLGAFSTEEGEEEIEISTPEQFLERFTKEANKKASRQIEDFIGKFGEDYQNAFEAIYVNGVDPKDYFTSYNAIQNFAEMDMTKEANQIAVLRQGLKDMDYDAEDIETEVERIKNYGDLESVAQKHQKILIKKESAKLQQLEESKTQKLQQEYAAKQQYYKNVGTTLEKGIKDKEFEGIPMNQKLASEIHDFLITEKYKTPTGEKLTDFDKTILDLKRPENHAKKVKIATLLKIMEKDPSFSTIAKAGVSKESNKIFNNVSRLNQKEEKTNKEISASKWQL